jgi:hypothetical protein
LTRDGETENDALPKIEGLIPAEEKIDAHKKEEGQIILQQQRINDLKEDIMNLATLRRLVSHRRA